MLGIQQRSAWFLTHRVRTMMPRDSALYGKLVTRLRAMIEAEVNRVLNYAVALHRPCVLAVERLDFRGLGVTTKGIGKHEGLSFVNQIALR